jgi:hypothetical protein
MRLSENSPNQRKTAPQATSKIATASLAMPLAWTKRKVVGESWIFRSISQMTALASILFTAPATRQAFGEVNRALRAQDLAARFTTAHCLTIVMVKTPRSGKAGDLGQCGNRYGTTASVAPNQSR